MADYIMRGFRFHAAPEMTVIHSAEFAQEGAVLSGTFAVSALARLAAETADTSGAIAWQLTGFIDPLQRPALRLSLQGELRLVCQRCLQAMPWQLESTVVLTQFAAEADIDEAERLDEDLDGILIEPELDIAVLVEDEILLSLPMSPMHDQCDDDKLPANAAGDKPNPFAVLAQLKTRKAE